MFKGNGSFKYGCGLLETIIQTKVLPKHLSDRLMWNRFYNRYNRWDSNIPLDLQVCVEDQAQIKQLINDQYNQTLTSFSLKFMMHVNPKP